MKHYLTGGFLAALLLAEAGTGCRPLHRREFRKIYDQGILALSTTNPFLASNLWLAKEAEESRYLYKFLQERGAPLAVELGSAGRDAVFYYPNEKELYVAAYQGVDWLVTGPFPLHRSKFLALRAITANDSNMPLLNLWGKNVRLGKEVDTMADDGYLLAPLMDLPPIYQPTPFVRRPVAPTPTPSPTPIPPPQNFDQRALQLSKEAGVDTAQDVFHLVSEGETSWEKLVEWYTGSQASIPQIKELNSVKSLAPGEIIRIPSALVKRRDPFQEKPKN